MIDTLTNWTDNPNISERKATARAFLAFGGMVTLVVMAFFVIVLLFTFFPYIGLLLAAIGFYRFVMWALEE